MNFLTLSQLILEAIKALTHSSGCRSHLQCEIENLKILLNKGVDFLKSEHEKQSPPQESHISQGEL